MSPVDLNERLGRKIFYLATYGQYCGNKLRACTVLPLHLFTKSPAKTLITDRLIAIAAISGFDSSGRRARCCR